MGVGGGVGKMVVVQGFGEADAEKQGEQQEQHQCQ